MMNHLELLLSGNFVLKLKGHKISSICVHTPIHSATFDFHLNSIMVDIIITNTFPMIDSQVAHFGQYIWNDFRARTV